jgi:hypothetical protein
VLTLAVLLVAALSAAALVPATEPYRLYLSAAALALSVLALIGLLARPRAAAPAPQPEAEPVRPEPPPEPARPEPEIVGFLAILQEKGRLVDFLMDDIDAYSDAQVGAAARVVHAGCRSVLQEHFGIRPVREEPEGATVQVPAGYAADEYRLVGKVAGQAPFAGVLVHRGWRTERVKLPRLLHAPDGRLPTVAPAEVELK